MIRPVLLCQGFQRAFVDVAGPMFSMSASVRRNTCEQLLKHARASRWAIVHCFLETDAFDGVGAASMEGFAPTPKEPYFRQKTLSAFGAPGLQAKLEALACAPIIFMSYAGLGAIVATLIDSLERGFPLHIVSDAIADVAHSGVGEQERLAAIETMARAHGRFVRYADAMAIGGVGSPAYARVAADRLA